MANTARPVTLKNVLLCALCFCVAFAAWGALVRNISQLPPLAVTLLLVTGFVSPCIGVGLLFQRMLYGIIFGVIAAVLLWLLVMVIAYIVVSGLDHT